MSSHLSPRNYGTESDPLVSPRKGNKRVQRLHKCGAEFIGTYFLMLGIGCNVIAGAGHSQFVGMSIAAGLVVMLYAFATVSGSHFNPAVTLAVYLCKPGFSAKTMIFYMVFQVFGALAAMGTYQGLFRAAYGDGAYVPLGPNKDSAFGMVDAVLVEAIFTLLLTLTVLNVALPKAAQGNEYFGLAIGFAVLCGAYAAGGISGGVMNPAVAIAASIENARFSECLFYCIAQLVAAVIAAALYRFLLRPTEFGLESLGVVSKLAAEFLGTFFLVFGVGLYVLIGSAATAAMAIGFLLMVQVYMFGNLSGGHVNPAVTVAILFSGRGKISARKAAMYVVTQLVAGIFAGVLFGAIAGKTGKFDLSPRAMPNGGSYTTPLLVVAEALMTFILCFTVLTVATTKKPLGQFYGLAIGLTIIAGGYALGSISGGMINPAVTLGGYFSRFLTGGAPYFTDIFPYWGGQFLGAAISACVFSALHVDEFEAEIDLPN